MRLDGRALAVVHGQESTLSCHDVAAGREIFRAPTGPCPSGACLSSDRKLLYVTGYGRPGSDPATERGHAVDVFDLRRRKSVGSIPLGRHLRPIGIAVHSGGRLFVTCEDDETLLILRLEDDSLHHAVPLDQHHPRAIAVSPDGRTAFTANAGSGSVSGIDIMMGVVLRTLELEGRPEGMAFSPDGRTLYVALPEAGSVVLVDAVRIEKTGVIETGPCPVRLAVTPDGGRLAVLLHHGKALEIVDTAARKRTHAVPIEGGPTHLAMSTDGELAFASCEEGRVEVISLVDARIVTTLATGGRPEATVPLALADLA
jgi:DNA-binding beta-propeller fold protein YncE